MLTLQYGNSQFLVEQNSNYNSRRCFESENLHEIDMSKQASKTAYDLLSDRKQHTSIRWLTSTNGHGSSPIRWQLPTDSIDLREKPIST